MFRLRPVATAALVAVALLMGSTPARAGGPAHVAAPVQPAAEQPVAGLLELIEQTPVVPPGGVFSLRIRPTGAPPGAQLEVEVRNRVRTRSEFAQSLEGNSLRSRISPSAPMPLDGLDRDATGTVLLQIPTSDSGDGGGAVPIENPGVYPVVVELLDPNGSRLDRLITYLVRLPEEGDESPPLDVAVVLPLRSAPALQPDGTTVVAPETRAGLVTTASALLNHPEVALTVASTPETLEALAEASGPDDLSVLESLRAALDNRQVLDAPFVSLDLAAWLDAGMTPGLTAQFQRGRAVITDQLGPPDTATWVADPSFDQEALDWQAARGIRQVVVPELSLSPLDPDDFPTTLAQTFRVDTSDGVLGAAADAGLSAHLADIDSDQPVLQANHLLADLAVIYFDRPPAQRGVVVVPPADWRPGPDLLASLLTGLTAASDASLLRPVDLNSFFAEVPTAGAESATSTDGPRLVRTLAPAPPDDLGQLPEQFASAAASIQTYRSAIGPESPRADPLAEQLLVAGAGNLAEADRQRYFDGIESSISAELAHVELPEPQTITLTDREGQVPLVFHNRAGYPLSIEVRLEAPRLEFPELANSTLNLDLVEETTRVEVTVETRTSGDSPLDLVVVTPDGRRQLGETRFTIRSTAVSGVGVVLSIGAGAFLILWWGRNVRRTRRNRRLVARTVP